MTSEQQTADSAKTGAPNKKRRRNFLLFFLFGIIITSSLVYAFRDKISWMGKVKEGYVEYDVTYPGIEEGNMMAAGLPDEATYYFKGKKTLTHLSGMMGLFSIGYIADEETKTAMQSLVLFNNKYVAELGEEGVKKMNLGFVKSIEPIEGEKKKIAEYSCKKAKATLENGKVIDIWYTTELGSAGANWSTPYSTISGILMEFEIEKYGITMKLVAKKVTAQSVNDEEFTVASDFKRMPIEELENIMKTLNPVK